MRTTHTDHNLSPSLVAYWPVVVALIFMLPRMIHAKFGLLDDGVLVMAARRILDDPSISLTMFAGAGRFLPTYWLYYAFWYALAGNEPLLFYIGHALLFALTVATIIGLMRIGEATVFETSIASLLFIFSAPATEAFFTLSKGEAIMLLPLLASLLMLRKASRGRYRVAFILAAVLLVVISVTTRETSVAALGAAIGWLALSYVDRTDPRLPIARPYLAMYAAALLVAVAIVLTMRLVLVASADTPSYASRYQLAWPALVQNLLAWSYSLTRDFPVTCLLSVCAPLLAWRSVVKRRSLLLMALVWMAAWAVVLLPWPEFHPYYQLGFAVGSGVFGGLMAGAVLEAVQDGRAGARATIGAIVLLLGVLIVNNVNYARYQLMVDSANDDLLDHLQRLPANSTVLVNYPFNHEFVYEIGVHLSELLGRPDIRLAPLNFEPRDWRDGGHDYYVITLHLLNELWPPVRGPMAESAVAQWNDALEGFLGSHREPLATITEAMQMLDFGLQAVWCMATRVTGPPLSAMFCQAHPRPVIDVRTASYGWAIYTYPRWQSPPVLPAVFLPDGTWLIEREDGVTLKRLLGVTGDIPVPADWDGDGLVEAAVYRPSTNTWLVDFDMDAKPDRTFALADMQLEDIPVFGDWDGDGQADPGFYRPSDGTWRLLRDVPNGREDTALVQFGDRSVWPIAGDWDLDGYDTPGLYHQNGTVTLIDTLRENASRVTYSIAAGGTPFVTNWSGMGSDTVNVVVDGKWVRRFANCTCSLSNDPPAFASNLPPGRYFAARWKLPATK